jgi:hypothetical protein
VRWGNVAQLAALLAAVALIVFGPRGCGSEAESIPLDGLPGEPVEAFAPRAVPPRVRPDSPPTRPPRDQLRRRARPPRRRETAGLGRGVVVPSVAVVPEPPRAPGQPLRLRLIPEAVREFSFDR